MGGNHGLISARHRARFGSILLATVVTLATLVFAGCADATVTVFSGTPTTASGTTLPDATATPAGPGPTATPNPSRYDGTWVDNVAGSSGQAGELVITNSGNVATVQGYGLCGTKCDWHTATSAVGAFNLAVNFTLGGSESAALTMQLSSNNLKVVDADTHFGTSTYFMHRASTAEARAFLYVSAWINDDAHTSGVTELLINGLGTALTVHGYGACTPTDCDWGTRSGTYTADPFHVLFDFGGGLTDNLSLSLLDSAGTKLQCVVVGSSSGTHTYTFHKSIVA